MEKTEAKGVRKIWDRYKYAAMVALAGAGLLLWPSGKSAGGGTGGVKVETKTDAAELAGTLQEELESILAQISGVGQVRVLLTVDSDGERRLAQDAELSYSGDTKAPEEYSRRSETVLVDGGSGETVVVTRTVYPTYRGALVVCQGGDNAEVRLAVTEAVSALTGLSSDRVTVAKWQ